MEILILKVAFRPMKEDDIMALEKGTKVKVLDAQGIRFALDLGEDLSGWKPFKIGEVGVIVGFESSSVVGTDWYKVKFESSGEEVTLPSNWFEVVKEPEEKEEGQASEGKVLTITYDELNQEWNFDSSAELNEDLEVDPYILDNTVDTLFRLLGLIND